MGAGNCCPRGASGSTSRPSSAFCMGVVLCLQGVVVLLCYNFFFSHTPQCLFSCKLQPGRWPFYMVGSAIHRIGRMGPEGTREGAEWGQKGQGKESINAGGGFPGDSPALAEKARRHSRERHAAHMKCCSRAAGVEHRQNRIGGENWGLRKQRRLHAGHLARRQATPAWLAWPCGAAVES